MCMVLIPLKGAFYVSTLSLPPPDKKNEKTPYLGVFVRVFLEGFGRYVRVFWGGFWMVLGGVFRGV